MCRRMFGLRWYAPGYLIDCFICPPFFLIYCQTTNGFLRGLRTALEPLCSSHHDCGQAVVVGRLCVTDAVGAATGAARSPGFGVRASCCRVSSSRTRFPTAKACAAGWPACAPRRYGIACLRDMAAIVTLARLGSPWHRRRHRCPWQSAPGLRRWL